jgi:hypothetical protein
MTANKKGSARHFLGTRITTLVKLTNELNIKLLLKKNKSNNIILGIATIIPLI